MSLQIIERRMRELVELGESDTTMDVGPALARLLATAWELRRPVTASVG